jgi:uncharacterized protein (TIGR03437 family)
MTSRVFLYLAVAVCAQGQAVHFDWVQQVGGSQGQTIAGVATDPLGNVYVVGNTSSIDFPVKGAVQPRPGGASLSLITGPGAAQPIPNTGLNAVVVLVKDPANSQTMYATDGRSLVRSTDAAASWSLVAKFDSSLGSLAIDSSAPNVLYAGTYGQGLFKSTDRGATWTAANNGIAPNAGDGRTYVFGVWIDARQPSVLLANTGMGLMRSADAAASWQPAIQPSVFYTSSTVTFDPANPGVVYVGTGSSILKSTDEGVTWAAVPLPGPVNVSPYAVLFDPRHSATLVVVGYSGFYTSSDGGNSWQQKYTGNVVTATFDAAGTFYWASYNTVNASADGLATSTAIGPLFAGVVTMSALGTRLFVGTQASSDVFAAKLDAQGNVLYATYFGGSASEQAKAMAVDSSGAVYVTGTTGSSDFPVTKGAYAKSGGSFLFKLNADGSVGYSTYFASSQTTPAAIAVDASGNAYIGGFTLGGLPTTPGAYQTEFQGSYPPCCSIGPGLPPPTNGFVTKFSPDGGSLAFSTYFGKQSVQVAALALRPNGEAVLAGGSQLYRMSADGGSLLKTGSVNGSIFSLVSDAAGNIFVGGQAAPQNFPVTPGAFQTSVRFVYGSGFSSGFVARLDDQFAITAATLLAGEGGDNTLSLAMAANGDVLAAGATSSRGFPLRGAAQGAFSGGTGFVAELTPDLSSAVFSTFAGDTRVFNVRSVAPAADGGVIFGGATISAPYYSYMGIYNDLSPGAAQAFVVKAAVRPAMPRIDSVVNAANQLGTPLSQGGTFIVRGDGFGDDATLTINGNAVPLLAHTRTSLTAVLPANFTGAGGVTVAVQSGGSTSNPFEAEYQPTAPGIFSVDGTGAGQGYILNADGTLNSPTNPAAEGAEVTIFATGVGHLSFDNGYAVTDTTPVVSIDGFGAPGIAAVFRPVDGLPGNVYQISVYVPHPADFAAGNANLKDFKMPPTVPVFLTVNGATSQYGLTLSVAQ